MNKNGKMAVLVTALFLTLFLLEGCSIKEEKNLKNDDVLADNVIITETGEVLVKESSEPEQTVISDMEGKLLEEQRKNAVITVQTEDGSMKELELQEPEQEKIITHEDQINPTDRELQLVFLGDSIFDNNRDGSGIPFLTAEQCEADVYNLAIGGTSAAIERDESAENEKWTSRGLCGVVKALNGEIPTDIFAGTRTKEILDNPDIDFSKTDYFIIEYGTNDFFMAVPKSSEDGYDVKTYGGALRYAVSNLRDCAPDATIILCSPCYAQFFDGTWMVGDGNVTNTGYGTLFDYKGTCNYVANDCQTLFLNAYQDLGINGYTAEEYLEDGVHLTEKGRRLYADALAHIILSYEETKNN